MLQPALLPRIVALAGALVAMSADPAWSDWSIQRIGSTVVSPPTGAIIAEMSGISYAGLSAGGGYRFLVAQENNGLLAAFDLHFDQAGAIALIDGVETIAVNSTLDYEGLAVIDAESVFLSEEDSPGVRRFCLVDGSQLQSVAIPPVFAKRRGNRGFESLVLSGDGSTLWTANEEALTVDGPASTTTAGTTVRLLQFQMDGANVSPTTQYAYELEPIHESGLLNTQQNGLTDLAFLPDGSLIALERSFALAGSPTYWNRIFQIDLDGATDVGGTLFSDGLYEQHYTSVGKELLWEGTVDGASGQNLEGLTLGPHLDNGDWVLLGVVDNGDPFSANTLATFRLRDDSIDTFQADFDSNGLIDGADFLRWQRGFGDSPTASLADGDGNGDGRVDAADLAGWTTAVSVSGPTTGGATAAPEPLSSALATSALLVVVLLQQWQTGFRQNFSYLGQSRRLFPGTEASPRRQRPTQAHQSEYYIRFLLRSSAAPTECSR